MDKLIVYVFVRFPSSMTATVRIMVKVLKWDYKLPHTISPDRFIVTSLDKLNF